MSYQLLLSVYTDSKSEESSNNNKKRSKILSQPNKNRQDIRSVVLRMDLRGK
jgi:hypothetical protein